MKKIYIFITIIAIVLGVTNILTLMYVKTQNTQTTYYNESFFRGTNNLIENYQKVLDLEKNYIAETNDVKRQERLETFKELVFFLDNHSNSVRNLLYKQVQLDKYVVLETAISKEIFLFQQAVSDTERQEHVEKLEIALNKFDSYIQEQMKKNNICVDDSCDN